MEGDFETVVVNLAGAPAFLYRAYTVLASILFLLVPFLTFGLALSFFKNASGYSRYLTHYNADTYIFSELNEQSLALAKSLHENKSGRFLVFTDVFDDEEARNELVESARAIGAVCFKKAMSIIGFFLGIIAMLIIFCIWFSFVGALIALLIDGVAVFFFIRKLIKLKKATRAK